MRTKIFLTLLATVAVVGALAASSLAGTAAKPAVSFTTPKAAAATASKVTFRVKLAGFTIDAANVGKANMANRGHLHFAMDGGRYDYPKYSGPNGKLAAQLGIAGKYSPSVMPAITYSRLPKGKHTLTVFLVNNDHSNTGAKARVAFVVR